MKTLHLFVDPKNLDSTESLHTLDRAASILRGEGLVAFPTETVYGLGASALSEAAAEKIFLAKQRPRWDPLIVHVSDMAMLSTVVAANRLTPCAKALMNAFWPGPLTLLLPKAEAVPPMITAGRPLVGVRIPAHPVARSLIQAVGLPIAAPSANRFGRISPTLAAHVLEDLDGRIDAVLDSGETAHGLESTVVDASGASAIVYRPGVIGLREIRDVCGAAEQWKQPDIPREDLGPATEMPPESLPSPGIGIRHYAPRARLVLIDGTSVELPALFAQAVQNAIVENAQIDAPVGIMLPVNFPRQAVPKQPGQAVVYEWGNWHDLPQLAHRLFAGLRHLDAAGVGLILCPLPPAEGIGTAIRDRLLKAARAR